MHAKVSQKPRQRVRAPVARLLPYFAGRGQGGASAPILGFEEVKLESELGFAKPSEFRRDTLALSCVELARSARASTGEANQSRRYGCLLPRPLLSPRIRTLTQLKPRTGCGAYGSSREAISSGVSRSESAATAS